jgi:hypothetical protein
MIVSKTKAKSKHKVNKQVFFNWYFKEQPKEQISAFLAPYLLGLVHKDAHFGLQDVLESVAYIPTDIIRHYTGQKNTVTTENVELVK